MADVNIDDLPEEPKDADKAGVPDGELADEDLDKVSGGVGVPFTGTHAPHIQLGRGGSVFGPRG